jgi:hypothetical protein
MFQTIDVEKIKTHFTFNNFSSENRAVYEIMWKNVIQPGRPQVTLRDMRIAYWITNATNTHSEYVILALLLQQWLHERASVLYYTYITCLV